MAAIEDNDLRLVGLLLEAGANPKRLRPQKFWERRRGQDTARWPDQTANGILSENTKRRTEEELAQEQAAWDPRGSGLLQRFLVKSSLIQLGGTDALIYAIQYRRPAIVRHLLVWDERRHKADGRDVMYSEESIRSLCAANPSYDDDTAKHNERDIMDILLDAASRRGLNEQRYGGVEAANSAAISGRSIGEQHRLATHIDCREENFKTVEYYYDKPSVGLRLARSMGAGARRMVSAASQESRSRARALTGWLYDRGVFYLDENNMPKPLIRANLDASRLREWGIEHVARLNISLDELEALVRRLNMQNHEVIKSLRDTLQDRDITALYNNLEMQLQVLLRL